MSGSIYTDSSAIQISYTVPWAGLLMTLCSTQFPASADAERLGQSDRDFIFEERPKNTMSKESYRPKPAP